MGVAGGGTLGSPGVVVVVVRVFLLEVWFSPLSSLLPLLRWTLVSAFFGATRAMGVERFVRSPPIAMEASSSTAVRGMAAFRVSPPPSPPFCRTPLPPLASSFPSSLAFFFFCVGVGVVVFFSMCCTFWCPLPPSSAGVWGVGIFFFCSRVVLLLPLRRLEAAFSSPPFAASWGGTMVLGGVEAASPSFSAFPSKGRREEEEEEDGLGRVGPPVDASAFSPNSTKEEEAVAPFSSSSSHTIDEARRDSRREGGMGFIPFFPSATGDACDTDAARRGLPSIDGGRRGVAGGGPFSSPPPSVVSSFPAGGGGRPHPPSPSCPLPTSPDVRRGGNAA